MRNNIGILFLLLVGLAESGFALVQVDLTGETGHLQYETTAYPRFHLEKLNSRQIGTPGILYDIDRDGYQDWIRSNFDYISAVGYSANNHVTYYQINLDPEFCRESGSSFALSGEMDLDRDGITEIVATGHTEDRMGWRFWIIDPRDGNIKGSFDLPGGEDIRADGLWDGNYCVIGSLSFPVNGEEKAALVLCVNIGHDIEGRGVLAVDPWTGDILWRFVTGPNPLPHSTKVVDLDHDGTAEVVVYGRAPDNLGGRKINGYGDDESRLFVLDNQGQMLWTRRLGGWFGGGFLITADLNDDGSEEIITTTHTTPDVWGEIAVWSHDGRSLARHSEEDLFQDVALIPADKDRANRLVVSAVSGTLRVFEFHPPELEIIAEVHTKSCATTNCVADLVPSEGMELVISTHQGITWVLDQDFQPLSRFENQGQFWRSTLVPWEPGPGIEILMHEFGSGFPLQFAKAPPPPLNRALVFGAISALLVLIAGFIIWKRLPTQKGDPVVLREVRLHLLEDLELSNHGAIAPLKCVRRLIWHMNAMTSGLGDNLSIEPRLRETWTECVDNALPHLSGILDRARLAGLAGANVDFADRSLVRIREQLDELKKEDFNEACFEAVGAKLNAETVKADDALKDLRQEVAGYFHSDLPATVTRVLRANSMAIEESGVAVQTGFLAQMSAGGEDTLSKRPNPDVVCLIDPKELDFILDNLVGNAVRSMKNSATRNLAVTWTQADGMVSVDVRDSGHGIPDELRGKILDTKFSTREGGGQGLPKSRMILRKYGGGLMVLDSAPNHGTTFRLSLPAAM